MNKKDLEELIKKLYEKYPNKFDLNDALSQELGAIFWRSDVFHDAQEIIEELDKPRIHKEWDDTANESIHITKPDGTQMIFHPDGREEIIDEEHPRYNHWHGR